MILELEVRHPGDKSLWKSQIGWKIKKRCQISGRWRDGVKIGNAISRRGEGHDMANSKSCQTAETIETQWNQHWKITDGETVAGQVSQGFVENGVKGHGNYSERHGSERWIEDGFGKEKIMETNLKQPRPEK